MTFGTTLVLEREEVSVTVLAVSFSPPSTWMRATLMHSDADRKILFVNGHFFS